VVTEAEFRRLADQVGLDPGDIEHLWLRRDVNGTYDEQTPFTLLAWFNMIREVDDGR
jgi:hypothetical protein